MDVEMTVYELGVKSRSKRLLYNLLQSEENIYLPPSREANAKYLSDKISGSKDVGVCVLNSLISLSMVIKQESSMF